MKSKRISLNSSGNLVLPTNPVVEDNGPQIATTKFVRDAIANYATVTAGSISTDKIGNGAVSNDKLSYQSVTSDKIANAAVTSSKLDSIIDIATLNTNTSNEKTTIISNPGLPFISSQTKRADISLSGQGNNTSCSISNTGTYQLACLGNHFRISSNSGSSWGQPTFTTALEPISGTFRSSFMSLDGKIQIVGNTGGNSYRSTNFGANWSVYSSISNALEMVGSYNVIASNSPQYILYTTSSEIKLSTNSGVSYTTLSLTNVGSTGSIGLGMSGDGKYMVIRGSTSYISSNYGSTWNPITSVNLGSGYRANVAISLDGKYMVACGDPPSTNNYFSSDYGATWTTKTITSAYKCAISSTGQFVLLNKHDGRHYYSSDYGNTFIQSIEANSSMTYSSACALSNNGAYFLVIDQAGLYSFVNTLTSIDTGSLQVKSMGAGVVKSNASGVLSSALIAASDIIDSTITSAKIVNGAITSAKLNSSIVLPADSTAITQNAGDSSTKIATTAFVTTALSAVPTTEYGSQLLHVNISDFSKNFQAMADQTNINLFNSANFTPGTNYLDEKFGNSANYNNTFKKYMATTYGLYKFEYNVDITNANSMPFNFRIISDYAGGAPINRVVYTGLITDLKTSGYFEVKLVTGGTVYMEVDMPQVGLGGTKTLTFNNIKLVGHLISRNLFYSSA